MWYDSVRDNFNFLPNGAVNGFTGWLSAFWQVTLFLPVVQVLTILYVDHITKSSPTCNF